MSRLIVSLLLAVVLCAAVSQHGANSLSSDVKQSETDTSLTAMRRERRATWLETRDVTATTKLHVLQALQDLIREGFVNPEVLRNKLGSDKRNVGLCSKKNKAGKTLAIACYTDDEDMEKK